MAFTKINYDLPLWGEIILTINMLRSKQDLVCMTDVFKYLRSIDKASNFSWINPVCNALQKDGFIKVSVEGRRRNISLTTLGNRTALSLIELNKCLSKKNKEVEK